MNPLTPDRCKMCLLLVVQQLQDCAHCGQLFCGRHMVEHDKKVLFELRDVPNLMKIQRPI
jgi:hypothetical protein